VGKPILLGITKSIVEHRIALFGRFVPRNHPGFDGGFDQRKVDDLLGLKENVIVGRLIPAGTGLASYRDTYVKLPVEVEETGTHGCGTR